MNIIGENNDRWDFIRLLFYLNDHQTNPHWEQDLYLVKGKIFTRPTSWPERRPLVSIVGFCLLDNHYHLLIKEIEAGGLTKFMRIERGLTLVFNCI